MATECFPELVDEDTKLRYYRELNAKNKDMLVTYWRRTLHALFEEFRGVAAMKFSDLQRFFIIDGFKVACMAKVLAELAEEKSYLILENLDVDVEKKLLNLRPENQSGAGGLLDTITGFFFHRLPAYDQAPESIKHDHFVVSVKVLEGKVLQYSGRDCHILRERAFRDRLFLSRQEMVEFFEREGEDEHDAYLIIHSLVERHMLHHSKNKDDYGRMVKGYIMQDPNSMEYKTNYAIFQVQKNIRFLDGKIEELEIDVRLQHDKILEALKHKSKEVAKTLGREKLRIEKQIVFLINKKVILSDKLDQMKDSLVNDIPEEVWKITKELAEKRMLDLDDIQDAMLTMNELKEKDKAVYDQMGSDNDEDERELQKELEKIEAEMLLKPLISPYKSQKMDAEANPNLLKNPFPTTQKKPESVNPLLANLVPDQGKQFSFFGNNLGS